MARVHRAGSALAFRDRRGPGAGRWATNGMGSRCGTTAASFLRDTIEESRDPNVRYAAYDSLASPDATTTRSSGPGRRKSSVDQAEGDRQGADRDPRRDLPDPGGAPPSRRSTTFILAATNDDDPLVRAEACRASGRVGRPRTRPSWPG